ncbi:lipoprotein [Actinoplanes solisilvae]|uniref:lipoprotein n=1 Tax=Actinoplanes solisilvae TaxID=2486853 RepID=UPI000FD72BBC|nr:lipoprotein [Actinoplanes solisilvae]
MRPRHVFVAALVAASLTLGACSTAEPDTQPGPSKGPGAATEAAKVSSGCPLPVEFGIAESWKPKAVQVEDADLLAELARRGPLTMACEIDAKPAGNLGFLRVWTGAKADLRTSLTAFIGKKAEEPVFTEVKIADHAAVEVSYREKATPEDPAELEKAFIVETGKGVAVVSLDSLDSEEHAEMLPAYELAKTSLTVTG